MNVPCGIVIDYVKKNVCIYVVYFITDLEETRVLWEVWQGLQSGD